MFLLQEAISPCGEPKTYQATMEMVQKSYLSWSIAPDTKAEGGGHTEYQHLIHRSRWGFQGKGAWNRARWAIDGE